MSAPRAATPGAPSCMSTATHHWTSAVSDTLPPCDERSAVTLDPSSAQTAAQVRRALETESLKVPKKTIEAAPTEPTESTPQEPANIAPEGPADAAPKSAAKDDLPVDTERRGGPSAAAGLPPALPSQKGAVLSAEGLTHMNDMLVAHGWKPQPVAVAFEGLRVLDSGARDAVAPTVGRWLSAPWRKFRGRIAPPADPVVRVGRGAGVTGYVRPGDMLLVMGPPGSGCTTLLKALAGLRAGVKVRCQKLLYNGKPSLRDAGARGLYLHEEDIHLPMLTVEQTLRFAAELGTPDEWQLPGITRKAFVDKFVQTMLSQLGLQHAAGTILGNNLLRGVSGGEKKRVSLAEAQALQSSLVCLDGWSHGLDSAAAMRICKQLRDITNAFGVSVVTSIYQISPEMFHPDYGFNNVLVLDRGRQLYFGPCTEAAAYFARILRRPPRRTLPDFLATVVDASVRAAEAAGGGPLVSFSESAQAAAADGLAQRWSASPELQAVLRRLPGARGSGVPPGADGVRRAPDRPEPTSLSNQFRHLLWRECILISRDKLQYLVGRVGRAVLMGLLDGGIWFNLGNDQGGAYSRTGASYCVLLLCAFVAFGAVADGISQRNVYAKQRSYGMLRYWMWFLVKFVSDLPISLFEAFTVGSLVYWMAGFAATFGQFFVHILALWLTSVCIGAIIRLMAAIAPDIDVAMAYSAGMCLVIIFFSGYMLPRESIPVYWIWAYYANPLRHGHHALLVNEFDGLRLNCSDSDLVRVELNGTEGTVCPLPTDGMDYLRLHLDISEGSLWVWWDMLIILGTVAVVMLLNARVVKKSTLGSRTAMLQFKDCKHRLATVSATLGQGAAGFSDLRPAAIAQAGMAPPSRPKRVQHRTELLWRSLTYRIADDGKGAVKGAKRTLLDCIDGVARPGEMTALMGPSGAGKTTLMDVLALRKESAGVEGDILLNGAPLEPSMRRCIGYVEQTSAHEGRATVREALLFSARLRLPDGADCEAKADETLRLLGLEELQDALIGDDTTEAGLSQEARKRVTIGVELVADPLVLFMDEPTTGLDTAGALAVLRCAKAIAETGRTVVMTIHQPSAELFGMFDALCLLQAGGRLAYCGRVHGEGQTTGCQAVLQYFSESGAMDAADLQGGDDSNPADLILRVLGSPGCGADSWAESPQAALLARQLQQAQCTERVAVPRPKHWWTQVRVLYGRTMQVFWRTPQYNFTRYVLALGTGLFLGSAYWQTGTGNGQRTPYNHVTCLFFMTFLSIATMMQAFPILFACRAVLDREAQSGMYNPFIFGSSYAIVELPFTAVFTAITGSVTYWMCGFQEDLGKFGYFLLMYFLLNCFAVYFGQMMAALMPSLLLGQLTIPAAAALWVTFCGFLVRVTDLAPGFRFLYYGNPYTFFIRGMITNLLHGRTFGCSAAETVSVPWPAANAASCNPIDSDRVLLGFDNSTGNCRVCPVTSGDQYLELYGWDYATRWTDVCIVLALVLAVQCGCQLLLCFKQRVVR